LHTSKPPTPPIAENQLILAKMFFFYVHTPHFLTFSKEKEQKNTPGKRNLRKQCYASFTCCMHRPRVDTKFRNKKITFVFREILILFSEILQTYITKFHEESTKFCETFQFGGFPIQIGQHKKCATDTKGACENRSTTKMCNKTLSVKFRNLYLRKILRNFAN
jgi:hypothetical protein